MSTQDSSTSSKPPKRYQECPWYERLWRRRHYLRVPYTCLKVYFSNRRAEDPDDTFTPREAWGLAIGLAQVKMQWWYTLEEVEEGLGLEGDNG